MATLKKHAGSSLVVALGLIALMVGGFATIEHLSHTPHPALRIAVAANFLAPAEALVSEFEEKTGHRVLLSAGSTGQMYAQIRNGAPYDLFLAADAKRPAMLEEEGEALADSRFTYAVGKLALWTSQPSLMDGSPNVLRKGSFRHIAMANPELAPYGEAARESLQNLGVWKELKNRVVLGTNVSQTYQFIHTGNAELGFIAFSQLGKCNGKGSCWVVPSTLHSPILQQAVLLEENPIAREFARFLRSAEAIEIIEDHGYGVPR